MLRLARVLGLCATIISFFPVILGAIGITARPKSERVLWAWVTLMAGLNLAMVALSTANREMGSLVNWSIPAFVLVGLAALGPMTPPGASQRWFGLGAGIYVLL